MTEIIKKYIDQIQIEMKRCQILISDLTGFGLVCSPMLLLANL
jgi:hypothetical protein